MLDDSSSVRLEIGSFCCVQAAIQASQKSQNPIKGMLGGDVMHGKCMDDDEGGINPQ